MPKIKNMLKFFCNYSDKNMMKNKAGAYEIDKETLDELREALLEKKKKIQEQLSVFAKKNGKIKDNYETNFPHIGDKEDENADEVEMYEDNLGVEHKLEEDLLAIDKALEKMEKGTYGICHNCGKPQMIEIKRLRAFPEAETCLKCEGKKA